MGSLRLALVDESALGSAAFAVLAARALPKGGAWHVIAPDPYRARGPISPAIARWARELELDGRLAILASRSLEANRRELTQILATSFARGDETIVVCEDAAFAASLRTRHVAALVVDVAGAAAILLATRAPAAPAPAKPSPSVAAPTHSRAHAPGSSSKASGSIHESSAIQFDRRVSGWRAQPRPARGERFTGAHANARLGSLLGEGGEGWVFEVEGDPRELVCKVPRRPDREHREHVRCLIGAPAPAGVAWPLGEVVDAEGQWYGWLLPRVHGVSLASRLVGAWEPRRSTAEPAFDRVRLARVARGFVARASEVRAMGVLIGDVQPKNLLVGDGDAVTLIDADSFQLPSRPSPVGVADYLHPELLDQNLRETPRLPHHEDFAIATLVFVTLHGGLHPYAHVGGGTPLENQRKRLFPYGLDGATDRTPHGARGPFARLWKELTPRLRRAFLACFETLRPVRLDLWPALLDEYLEALAHGRCSSALVPPPSPPEPAAPRRRKRTSRRRGADPDEAASDPT